MRGWCYALALYLADRSTMELYGCRDEDGVIHHAFVYDSVAGVAYDGRGRTSLDYVTRYRGVTCAGKHVGPAPRQEIEELARELAYKGPNDGEIRRFIAKGGFPELSRKRKPTSPCPEHPLTEPGQ